MRRKACSADFLFIIFAHSTRARVNVTSQHLNHSPGRPHTRPACPAFLFASRHELGIENVMSDLERGSVDETARLNGEPVLPGGRRKSSSSSGPSQISFRVMAAFAVFALLGTLGSFVTSWGGDIAQVLQLASHKTTPVSFIHVPRTAGTTLGFTVQALGVPITGEDRCYKYSHRENAINAVVFRDPTEHVLSLFGQCFANPHGAQSMSPLWGFPRGKKGDTPEAGWRNGLTKWLAHFGENWERERGYFNCFNPINMQARYLTCGGKDEIHDKEVHLGAERWGTPQKPGRAVWFQSAHYLGVNDAVEPDLDKVIRRLDSMQVVGVTEALKATTCLTEYYSRGTIHPSCECGSDERKVSNCISQIPRLCSHTRLTLFFYNKVPVETNTERELRAVSLFGALGESAGEFDERYQGGPRASPVRGETLHKGLAEGGGKDGQTVSLCLSAP
tara:strand:+ start:1298 stop:2638 length:1341 start_codon:yes stop_codon:yes gene_type:complete